MPDVSEKKTLLGIVKELAPNWNGGIEAALAAARIGSLRSLVEELKVAPEGGIAVTYSAQPDESGHIFCHRLARVHPNGELQVGEFGGVWYSGVDYEAEFTGQESEGLKLHLLSDRRGGYAERVFKNLLVCNANTGVSESSGGRRAVASYQVAGGEVRLDYTALDFGYSSGAVASAPGGFMPPTRSYLLGFIAFLF